MKGVRLWYKKSLKKISQVISNVPFNRAGICQVFCNIFSYKTHHHKIGIKQEIQAFFHPKNIET